MFEEAKSAVLFDVLLRVVLDDYPELNDVLESYLKSLCHRRYPGDWLDVEKRTSGYITLPLSLNIRLGAHEPRPYEHPTPVHRYNHRCGPDTGRVGYFSPRIQDMSLIQT